MHACILLVYPGVIDYPFSVYLHKTKWYLKSNLQMTFRADFTNSTKKSLSVRIHS